MKISVRTKKIWEIFSAGREERGEEKNALRDMGQHNSVVRKAWLICS